MTTLDGKILTSNWGENLQAIYGGAFEKYHNTFENQAWMCGRITMERDFAKGLISTLDKAPISITREAFIGNAEAKSFAIAVDAHGKLEWESNETGGDHIIEVLTENVSDDYLHYLQQLKISYIFGGEDTLDFAVVLGQLTLFFPIETMMLEGGGHLNGSLMNAGLIDELSLLLLPIADGTPKSPSLFEVSEHLNKNMAKHAKLKSIKQVENDIIWLRYEFQ